MENLQVNDIVDIIYTKKPKYKLAFSNFNVKITKITDTHIHFINEYGSNCSRVLSDFNSDFKIIIKN